MNKHIFCLFTVIYLMTQVGYTQSISISKIKCESKDNPLGVALEKLHFSWELQSNKRNQVQKAYQIVISSNQNLLKTGKYDVWNSGKIEDTSNILLTYHGTKLKSGTQYFWQVKIWDKENKPSAWSKTGEFVTGLFENKDWGNAKWIGFEEFPDSLWKLNNPLLAGSKAKARAVVPYFRKEFAINKKIVSAFAFVTGFGQYELSINGNKVGNSFLAPSWTYFDKTTLYNTYNITEELQKGNNAIGMLVGNGFYYINKERYTKLTVAFGLPKMICQVKITYADGTSETVVSNEEWMTAASPITFTSIYGGEDYDARLEQKGWDTPIFNTLNWKNALLVKPPKGVLLPDENYAIAVKDSFMVKSTTYNHGGTLYDFGQNLSGIIELKVKGEKGQTIKLTPSELITKDNLPNQSVTGSPYYWTYTLKGKGEETWRPRFTYYGFRYVFLENVKATNETNDNNTPKIISLTSLHTRNSAPEDGTFSCGNESFNQFNQLIKWAIKSNFQSLITDCPHREKLGWLEQDYLMGNSIHYNYDIYKLYKGIAFDMMDAQSVDGLVPDIAPEYTKFGGPFRDSPEWGSASIILPWLIYEWYGDKTVMESAYPMMEQYVSFLQKKSVNNILDYGLGDWYDLGPKFLGQAQLTPKAVTATAIYYYDLQLLAKMSSLINKKTETEKWLTLAEQVKTAFNAKFFDKDRKVYSTGSQTAMAMPLCVGLVKEVDKKAVLDNLEDSIYLHGKALTAGDVGFHFLIKALTDGGKNQLIYDMNARNDVPGYGFQLKKGATSLTESWAALERASNNHLMLGHIMEWFYAGLGGINQVENGVAFQKLEIKPEPVDGIPSAKTSFHTPYGIVSTDCVKTKEIFRLKVTIPVNSSANVYLPSKKSSTKVFESGKPIESLQEIKSIDFKEGKFVLQVGSGNYDFEVKE